MEQHPNFATFITGGSATTTAEASGGKKRKLADANAESDSVEGKDKKTAAKGKRSKKAKTEEPEEKIPTEGGDATGESICRQSVLKESHRTDVQAEEV